MSRATEAKKPGVPWWVFLLAGMLFGQNVYVASKARTVERQVEKLQRDIAAIRNPLPTENSKP